MNFEVFNTEKEMNERADELRAAGAEVITAFNGRAYTIKWK